MEMLILGCIVGYITSFIFNKIHKKKELSSSAIQYFALQAFILEKIKNNECVNVENTSMEMNSKWIKSKTSEEIEIILNRAMKSYI